MSARQPVPGTAPLGRLGTKTKKNHGHQHSASAAAEAAAPASVQHRHKTVALGTFPPRM